jgi:hypothetical protein
MKCPYRDFQECIVEKCPACNYEEAQHKVVHGRYPAWMSSEEAIRQGMAYESVESTYRFVSCKLVDCGVQPVPAIKQTVNNTTRTNVVVQKSVF